MREAQIPGYSGTTFSWAPAQPSSGGAAQGGDGGAGAQGGSAAPYSVGHAGYLVYNVGDNLLFADHHAASQASRDRAPEPEPEAVRVRETRDSGCDNPMWQRLQPGVPAAATLRAESAALGPHPYVSRSAPARARPRTTCTGAAVAVAVAVAMAVAAAAMVAATATAMAVRLAVRAAAR